MGGGGGGLGGLASSIGGAIDRATGTNIAGQVGNAFNGSALGQASNMAYTGAKDLFNTTGLGAAASLLGGIMGGPGSVDFDPMASGTNQSQIDQAYANTQTGLTQQADFLKAVQAQNGLQNQSNVFSQLQGVANGTGPNPAQAMLANATGANVANQAALMAGQRGASANPALMARQAAMTGANIQQQSAGQGAALQAQQSQNALNQMGSLATNQANMQANAGQQFMNSSLQQQQNLLGAQANANSANAGLTGKRMDQQANMQGNMLGAVGSVLGMFADGGAVTDPNQMIPAPAPMAQTQLQGPSSSFGRSLMDVQAPQFTPTPQNKGSQDALAGAAKMAMMFLAEGGKVPAMVSPGEVYLPPKDLSKVAKGADPIKTGEKIPGKPKYPGNDYRNDVVPKTLQEGGLVIPNEVLQSKDPHAAAADFVAKHLAGKSKIMPGPGQRKK